ncbi:MAG: transglutaminase domain-containing protein [Thermoplasmata archaeon]|nr:transglutaminase domain-containing protein [Thermoplasmata archaeon]
MPLGKTILITVILLISSFSGCTLLRQTRFTLLSLTVDDDNGFPRMYVQFNTTDTSTLMLTGPQQNILFSDTYYSGIHNESIYLAGYRTTVVAGTYSLKAVDSSKNTIFENELQFNGHNLSLISVYEDWWNGSTGSSAVTFHLSVKNSGDLPVYPFNITVSQGKNSVGAYLIPTAVLPSHTTQMTCFMLPTNMPSGGNQLNISLFDSTGAVLLQKTLTLVQKNPIDSWIYQWHYLGSQTLKIPEVDWFYDYYKSVKRFDIIDYAAYVFDRYDDLYIEFLADQLLLLKNLKTKVEKINFIASFVQGIEYKKDDPENETYEYPRYPLETLKEKRGDCEDKAILTAALLESLGYNVSLIRLPQHMAVGVHLNETISVYSYYIDQYYFLETTTLSMPLGKVPPEYQGLSNVTVYPISSRPLLIHNWKNATRFTMSTGADYVSVTMIFENLGTAASSDIEVRGAFYDNTSRVYNQETMSVPSIAAGEKRVVELSVDVPSLVSTTLKTQLYLNGMMVNQRESTSRFP